MIGLVHSIETFGAVDGPGIRFVIFLQGCPLRCLYCHNPDTWDAAQATPMTAEALINQYQKNHAFYQRGGITVTGGEPLLQLDFLIELFELAKASGIHTCLDTSGAMFDPQDTAKMDQMLRLCDLVLLDIKHMDDAIHQQLCAVSNQNILAFARHLDDLHIPVWIRHVIVPSLTDDFGALYRLGQFIGTLHNVAAIDILPFHQMGIIKYQALGMDYPLKDYRPAEKADVEQAKGTILKGIKSMNESGMVDQN